MKANNISTAVLQRQFRKWHQRCVFTGSELTVGFLSPKGKTRAKKNREVMAKCSVCLIDRFEDLGFSPPSRAEFRADNPVNKLKDKKPVKPIKPAKLVEVA